MLTGEKSDSVNTLKNVLSSKTLLSTIKRVDAQKSMFSGFVEIKIYDVNCDHNHQVWYLFFSKGKIVFSGNRLICFADVIAAIKSYLPIIRKKSSELEKITTVSASGINQDHTLMSKLFSDLVSKTNNLNQQKINQALESYLIEDAEKYLFNNAQTIKIFADPQIDYLRPILGLTVEDTLDKLKVRRSQWEKIKKIIPSFNYCPQCNLDSPQWQKLSSLEKFKVKKIVNSGETLAEIRYKLGEDSLKIAQTFSNLIKQNLVVINPVSASSAANQFLEIENSAEAAKPQLVIIDDSPVILKQFSSVVERLGYQIECCSDAFKAVAVLLKHQPEAIFIDINMPKLSGFQLIKQIRSQPKLASTPVVILTAEKTMLNQQRAKWSKSYFLSKALTPEDNQRFITELKSILHSLVPVK